jgi:hypothetical protein
MRPQDHEAWERDVAPIFERVCARCHMPSGSASVDLSTSTMWARRNGAIRAVLQARSMPPDDGVALTDTERAVLEHWLEQR